MCIVSIQILTFTASWFLCGDSSYIALLFIRSLIPLMMSVILCNAVLTTTGSHSLPCTVACPTPFTNVSNVGYHFSSCYRPLFLIGTYNQCVLACTSMSTRYLQLHVTPAASSGMQLCTPIGLRPHDNKSFSPPVHLTSSSKMGPFPTQLYHYYYIHSRSIHEKFLTWQ